MSRSKIDFKKAVLLSLLLSIIFYIFGIMVGIFFGGEVMESFSHMFSNFTYNFTYIKKEIQRVLGDVEDMKFLLLSEILSEDKKCIVLENVLNEIDKVLVDYCNMLPRRLEEYELSDKIPTQYFETKEEYQKLLIDRWLLAESFRKCNNNTVIILYFYKPKCEICVEQGKEMDKIIEYLKEKGYRVFGHTLDITQKNKILEIIKKTYNITDAPSFILNDTVFPNFTTFETVKVYLQKT